MHLIQDKSTNPSAPLVTGAKLTPAHIRQMLAANRIRRIKAEQIVAALRTTPLQVAPGTAEAASRHVVIGNAGTLRRPSLPQPRVS